ncbi:hypothetical protein PROFUN_15262 [Planoprotostelium fungivorum]|uniref:Uncharacterized protein n=1 Tax=Planoprotostelium fungivorum TaxID=1890364 RepID=A0A2P6MXG9_9EUKA|nr:hypothetical protein PROFUN_15262 [Planoprotostelium fungivorum]
MTHKILEPDWTTNLNLEWGKQTTLLSQRYKAQVGIVMKQKELLCHPNWSTQSE